MSNDEFLKDIAINNNIEIIEKNIKDDKLNGLYCDNTILINNILKKDKYIITLAHEIGHHFTLQGNNLLKRQEKGLYEFCADAWSYKTMFPLEKMAHYKYKDYETQDICDIENVNCEYIEKAFNYYKEKYGNEIVELENYKVRFYPTFQVVKIDKDFYDEY